ncbi:MAG: hypothetical protein JWM51_1016 [Microbacteriaceae bacterium]|nr:hypothetical protein [Microbacteriaceae bacterium]
MVKTTRAPVTRDRAIRVAMVLADAGGIDSLSMRKLAAELDVEAMSLYYHVKNKGDLLDGMLDAVYSEYFTPRAGDEWRPAMRARAESTRAVLASHPWAITMKSRTSPGTATLGHLDSVIGCLGAAGFPMPMIGHSMSVLDSYVQGFAQQEASLPLDPAGSISAATEEIIAQQSRMDENFPNLAEMARTLILTPGYAYGNEFGFGLELVLDGLEAALVGTPNRSAAASID